MQEPIIVYQDDSIIVINKPPGLPVHATGRAAGEHTLVRWLLAKFPELNGVGEDEGRPGIVHRLDRDTSGVMVFARTPSSYKRLKRQFQRREVQKTYRAFVYGNIKEERGIIDRPLGRTRGSGSRRSALDPHGTERAAQTIFHRVFATVAASYVEVFPKTGRTHQIRVHLASVGHPVICDALYAPRLPPLLGFSRLALHALSLAFAHPDSGKKVSFEAPLPPEFVAAEEKLRRA